ncbi:asparagine-linked glycosylation protein [Neophaeococcomyces mojaviensis]|uniref:Asparagine-linked glycosylation protein n=1 Tax=Neophaeococcomyces mojaviensis TaxID=3383035 RepID=A0ACC3AK51_9EURO|nr:asparagine-linked glycosylation protein [Knufia sp. JES_112]
MGYAFALAFSHYLFPSVPIAAYVHYPTISTDMLSSLDDKTGTKGIHSGAGTGLRGYAKKLYWHIFAYLYGWVGCRINVVMCNSTWTANHIRQLWKPTTPTILYPPCPVQEIESQTTLPTGQTDDRNPTVLYVAQFRPEKSHTLILNAFAKFYHAHSSLTSFTTKKPHLILIGSVRANTPDEKHVYALRLLARELKITDATTFITDAPFSLILQHLQTSSIGVNGMYAEHFGIGNVEGLAAGLIPVVHNSGGPKMDIVVPWQGKVIGFLAETEGEYADAFAKVLVETNERDRIEMRKRGRESARRFDGEVFVEGWLKEVGKLVDLRRKNTKS